MARFLDRIGEAWNALPLFLRHSTAVATVLLAAYTAVLLGNLMWPAFARGVSVASTLETAGTQAVSVNSVYVILFSISVALVLAFVPFHYMKIVLGILGPDDDFGMGGYLTAFICSAHIYGSFAGPVTQNGLNPLHWAPHPAMLVPLAALIPLLLAVTTSWPSSRNRGHCICVV